MNKVISVPMTTRHDEAQRGILIAFEDSIIQAWCLSLSLLQNKLVKQVHLRQENGDLLLDVSLKDSIPPADRGEVAITGNKLSLSLSQNELEMWTCWFLSYYRDGIAPVDHIDVDIPARQDNSRSGLFLTLKVRKATPPMSAEEAKKRINDQGKR
jgi:hypothetical protein